MKYPTKTTIACAISLKSTMRKIFTETGPVVQYIQGGGQAIITATVGAARGCD